ncbi:hypothetical protein COCMIDRAFT_26459 [Bipolaris oryzae ATCC 44560]|uniref:Uncharacterized protein n=1 Tax=Bipolaris oryzae ATCC 44560 TaxID=930090 RepID=W6Z0R3_COCMI|nr:uncharacterized protein COCMIDRAFT_26459 [Bipolaris oryzae ATCC 44560]EUC45337.1 hypothetical protein COCMIDRAFT_26459 [Bipolaris oryzae ATCC 44560]
MYASSFIALALGATAVSAAAFPNVQARQAVCDLCDFANLPSSLDCPANGGVHITDKELAAAIKAADRSQPPRETSASNLATSHCSGAEFRGIPLWTSDLPKGAGGVYYAMASNGTFYFCGTTSGRAPSGWPASCTENK